MSQFSFEDLLRTAAGDGGSLPGEPRRPLKSDFDELLQAWKIERGNSIECEILLNLSRMVIARLIANDRSQSLDEQEVTTTLIREIENRLQNCSPNRS